MKKIRFFLILTLISILLFSACSNENKSSDKDSTPSAGDAQKSQKEEKQQNNEDKNKDKNEDEDKKAEGTSEDSFVVNNGREFVKVGEKIYFRKFLSTDEAPLSVRGFYRTLFDGVRKSEFGYVTEDDKSFVKVFDDEGYGNIFYFENKFYLQKEIDDKYVLYSVNMDGSDQKVIKEADLMDIYEPLGYFILEVNGELQIMKNEEIIKEFKNDDTDFYAFNSIIGDKMIITRYSYHEESDSTISLYSISLDNFDDMVQLGVVKKPDAEMGILLNSSVSKVIEKDSKLWVEVTLTQGSARMFVGSSIFSAKAHEENSIKLEKSLVEEDIFDNIPNFDIVNGEVEFCMIKAGGTIADENGVFYNDSDKPTNEAIHYKIYSPKNYSNYFDLSYHAEVVEKVGDEIYFIMNTNRYYWEVGTHSTYFKLINSEYLCYDTKTKQTKSIFGELPENTEQYAFVWISKDPLQKDVVLYQMTEYLSASDSAQKKQFYGLSDEYFTDLYEIYELVPFANTANLDQDFIFGEDPVKKGEESKNAFFDFMTQKGAVTEFSEKFGTYDLPHEEYRQEGLVLAKLIFEPSGQKITKIEIIDYEAHLQ